MFWTILTTSTFDDWLTGLPRKAQAKIDVHVLMLETLGPTLPARYSKPVATSRFAMRELRVQVGGSPYRILHIFDPHRNVVLLLGGDKTGNDRWYEEHVPIADRLYAEYLLDLEGGPDGRSTLQAA